MGQRKITIKKSAAYQIAEIAFFIESKELVKTAEKFSNAAYDFIEKLANTDVIHKRCSEPKRNSLGLKCVSFRKKYTVVFIETESDLIVCEFLPSKLVHW
jgi:hypothetical protein